MIHRDANFPLIRGFLLFGLKFWNIISIGFAPVYSELMPYGVCRWGFLFSSTDFLFLAHLSLLRMSFWDTVMSVVRVDIRDVRDVCPSTFRLVYTLEGTVLIQSSWNFVRMLIIITSRSSSKLGHVESKTRSLDQILEKPCVHSVGHSFDHKFMK